MCFWVVLDWKIPGAKVRKFVKVNCANCVGYSSVALHSVALALLEPCIDTV